MALNALLPLLFILISSSAFVAQAGTVNCAFPSGDNIRTYNTTDSYIDSNAIQLTKNQAGGNLKGSSGWATCSNPIPMRDNSSGDLANFTSHFRFMIYKDPTVLGGDGITFFMAPFDAQPPVNSTGEWLGLFNQKVNGNSSNQIVAVEFDTYKNSFDPDDNHVGINVNSVTSLVNVSLYTNASAQPANESLKNGQYWDAWVDYDGGAEEIKVFLSLNPSGNGNNISKPGTPILSYKIDLRQFVPDKVKVGFSASTGLSYETNAIYYWNFSSQYSWEIIIPNGGGNSSSVKVILISVSASLFALCGLIFVGVWWHRRRRKSSGPGDAEESDVELDEWFAQGPRKFSYAELSAATRDFSDDEKLGQGGFGSVYRGILSSTNEVVAVKRISQDSKQGRKEYVSEVTIISKIRHRNLVQLLGWCHQKGELLLVYEYLPNGSLDSYLFGKKKGALDWDRRYMIACDIASALVYLHEDCEQRVVHRDVKSSNVMLDSDFNAKLGDFGLARLVGRDHPAHTTVVAGTFGYLAPECVYTGKTSTESDVFSFGALSLEIACGRRPVDRSSLDEERLVEWVWDLYGQGRLFDCVDQILDGNFKGDEMERLLLLGLLCSHPDPKARLKMRDVVKILKFEAQLPDVQMNLPVAVYDNPVSRGNESWRITGTSVSFSSAVHTSSSSSNTGSGTGLVSKPLLFYTDDHPAIQSR